jgi:hypothetical protein
MRGLRLVTIAALTSVLLGANVVRGGALTYDAGSDPVLGFNIWGVQNTPVGAAAWESAIQEMYDSGFRQVAIGHWRYMDADTGAVTSTDPVSWTGASTDAEIEAAVARAKSLGMSVTFRAFIEPFQGTNFFWRGSVNTNDTTRATFWSQYTPFVTSMASMAQQYGVERFMVGVEMEALASDAANSPYWTSLIDSVSNVYTGQIGYGSNHGNETNAVVTSTIWNHPDVSFMGTSAYFPLASNAEADNSGDASFEPLMEQRITAILDQLAPFAQSLHDGQGLPLVLSEFGSPPYNRGSVMPWDWTLAQSQPADAEEQYKVYEALLRATDGRFADLSEINAWVWGWPGGYNGEVFAFNPTPSGSNETLNYQTYQLLEGYVVPEPAIGPLVCLAGLWLLPWSRSRRRPRNTGVLPEPI